jgi:crotonobetainyl-CoA:carnitine CoA-transferase CaiB-like acyl-CoA transferase
MRTTRCPIRIDGERLTSPLAAPRIGEHNQAIAEEFNLE